MGQGVGSARGGKSVGVHGGVGSPLAEILLLGVRQPAVDCFKGQSGLIRPGSPVSTETGGQNDLECLIEIGGASYILWLWGSGRLPGGCIYQGSVPIRVDLKSIEVIELKRERPSSEW